MITNFLSVSPPFACISIRGILVYHNINKYILSGKRSFKGNGNKFGLAIKKSLLLGSYTWSSLMKIGILKATALGRQLEKKTLLLLVIAIGEGNL